MNPKRIPLPIDPILPDLMKTLERSPNLVLRAAPGSGKTTRVPPALLQASFTREGSRPLEILVLEPRRLAAKYAARRVAEELGENVGETIGYQFRFENVSSPRTRLRFLTEGMLMRRLLRDPVLKGVAAVILDEFHERHLHGDIALGYLRLLQNSRRPDLRIVVMSATLDTEAVAKFLADAPVLQVDTPVYPVTVEHLPSPPSRHLDQMVREAVQGVLREPGETPGDLLVFLPGMGDIRRCEQALAPLRERGVLVLPLHGELSREEQDLAIRKAPGRTKIILSTNVAETSLTIDGVTVVIDSGLHRQASYSWWSGVPSLRTRAISRASAIQRAGRAGRTAPGRCLRIYTQGDFASRPPFETPEINRADISQTFLELKAIGVPDLADFPWFEAPSPQSITSSVNLLHRLGALEKPETSSRLTALGRRLAELPAHPRIARFLMEAEKRGVLSEAATFAAMFSEGRIETLDALQALEQGGRDEGVRRARTHLLNGFQEPAARSGAGASHETLAQALLAGFPDRVARKRALPAHSSRGRALEVELVFSFGGSARIEESSLISSHEMFVVLDIQEQQGIGQARSQQRVRTLVPIEPEWLFDLEPSGIGEHEELIWDSERKRVWKSARMTYDELVLTESQETPAPGEAVALLLLKSVFGIDAQRAAQFSAADWVQAFSRFTDAEAIEGTLARISLFARNSGVKGLSDPSTEPPWPRIRHLLEGRLSQSELELLDWPQELATAFLPEHAHELERMVPASVHFPNGRRSRIHYRLGQAPWVESRLQDFFGMKTGPALFGGRLPLTLHLLAPNMRAIQVTTDLQGFWQRAYQEQRHALSRRYPRHKWPENPLELIRDDD